MSNYLEVQNISHKYGNKKILNNINLTVQKGEVTSLIGANGSGKTTLLRIIAGLETPSDGEIRVRGTAKNSEALRKLATMVFQKAVVFNTSVRENLAYGLGVREITGSQADEKIQRALKIVGLEDFEKRKAKRLSGGEQQRISLARALILEAEILLLDEPTANIDPKNASIIESVITNVNQELGTTIIMASHNMTQAKRLASKIAALQDGALVSYSSTSEIFDKPSNILDNIGRLQNVFPGHAYPTKEGLTIVDVGQNLKFEVNGKKEGPVTVFIRPEDILISEAPLVSSARNTLKGTIIETLDRNELVQLKVDAGKEFIATVTKKSFEEMNLNLGSEVYLTFKSQAVQVVT